MSDKLTKEMLDALIKETMLQEDFPYSVASNIASDDALFKARNAVRRTTSFNTIKDIEKPKDQVDELDFDKLISDPSLIDTDVEAALKVIATEGQPDAQAKAQAALDALEKSLEDKIGRRQTITQPQIRSAGGAYGQFPSELNTIVKKLFSSDDFATRITKVSDISNRFYNAAKGDASAVQEIKQLSNDQFLAELMMLEYFVEMASSFTAEAGGDLFEYFLAALAGKRVLGASKKGADFELPDGSLGSAKYFAQPSGMSQSPKGFNVNDKVVYYAALKKQGEEQAKDVKRGGTLAARLQSFQIYKFAVEKVEEATKKKSSKFNYYDKNDKIVKRNVRVGDSVELSHMINSKNLLATIRIVDTKTKTFREMLATGITDQNNAVKRQLLDAVESFFKSLEESNLKAKEYAASGDATKGTETMNSLDNSKTKFGEFQAKMSPPQSQVSENKMTELDLMVENMVKEFLKGNLND